MFQNPDLCDLTFLVFGATDKLGVGEKSCVSVGSAASPSQLFDCSRSSHLFHSLLTSSNWEGQESLSSASPPSPSTTSRNNCIPVLCTCLSLVKWERALVSKHDFFKSICTNNYRKYTHWRMTTGPSSWQKLQLQFPPSPSRMGGVHSDSWLAVIGMSS